MISSDPGCKGPVTAVQVITIHHVTYQLHNQDNNRQKTLIYKRVRYRILTLSFTLSTILNTTMIKLNTLYHFHPLHRHLDTSQTINPDS